MSLVLTAQRLPWLLLALVSGAYIDRTNHLSVMIGANAVRAVATAGLALLLALGYGSIPVLVGFALVLGITEVLFDTAAETAVPSLVHPPELPRANGHLRSAEFVANTFVGGPVGGVLLRLGTAVPFAVDAVLAAATVPVLVVLRRVVGEDRPDVPGRRSLPREVMAGLRVVADDPLLRVLVGCAVVMNTLYATMLSTQVVFARDSLGLGPIGYALLLASAAIGGVVGAQVTGRLVDRLGPGRTLRSALVTMGLCFCGVAVARPPVVVALLYAVASAAVAVWSVAGLSLRQQTASRETLGRVNATFRLATWGMSTLGMLLGGAVVAAARPIVGLDAALRLPYVLTGTAYLVLTPYVARRLTDLRPGGRTGRRRRHGRAAVAGSTSASALLDGDGGVGGVAEAVDVGVGQSVPEPGPEEQGGPAGGGADARGPADGLR